MLRAGGLALAAIVAAGAVLRFGTLGVQSFFDDELFTTWLAKKSFGDMLSTIPGSEATPPLFYIFEWVFARVFGTGEAGMRVLPALAGTLTIGAAYAAGAQLASRRVGLAAAAFVAVNPFLIWFSQEARAYSLMVLFVALSLAYLASLERGGGRMALAGWAATSALALATHYFAMFLIAPAAVWLVWAGRAGLRERLAAVAVPVVTALAFLPLALHQRSAVRDPGGLQGRSLLDRVAQVPKNFLVGFAIPAEIALTAIAAVLAVVAAVLAFRSRGAPRRLAVAMAALAACAVGIPLLLTPLGFDYVSSRNEIAVLVPIALLLACGFAANRTGALALAGIVAVSVGAVVSVAAGRRYQRRDWQGAAHALPPARGDRALVLSPDLSLAPFQVYFGRNTVVYPTRRRRMSEVAVVALARERGFGSGAAAPPTAPTPAPPPGFTKVQDTRTATYRVIRFRARRPTFLTSRQVKALGFPGEKTVYYWQLPVRS